MRNLGIHNRIIRGISCISMVLALVGTGFGVWVFTAKTEEETLATSIDLAAAMDFSGFGVTLNGTLTMDENGSTFSDCSLDVTTTVGIVKGVTGEGDTDDSGNPTYSIDAERNIKAISLTYDITCSFNDTTLNSYIYCKKISSCKNATPDEAVSSFSTYWVEEDTTGTGLALTDNITAHFPIVFDWKTDMRPTTTSEYATMMDNVKSLAANAITFKVSFDASAANSYFIYY